MGENITYGMVMVNSGKDLMKVGMICNICLMGKAWLLKFHLLLDLMVNFQICQLLIIQLWRFLIWKFQIWVVYHNLQHLLLPTMPLLLTILLLLLFNNNKIKYLMIKNQRLLLMNLYKKT